MQLLGNADLWLLLLLRLRGACAGPRPPHVMRRHGPCSPAGRLSLPLQRVGACRGSGRMQREQGMGGWAHLLGVQRCLPAVLPARGSVQGWPSVIAVPAVPAELAGC